MTPAALPTLAEIGTIAGRHPALFDRSWQARLQPYLVWGGVGLAVMFAFWWTGFTPARLWAGLSKLGWLFGHLFPPSTGGWLGYYLNGMLETVAMAFCGTAMAVLLALPIGFLAARNVLPNPLAHFALRRILDTLRGVDVLIWALMFVSAVGLGPFAGVMALMLSDTGTLSKLFAEAIENIERDQAEGVRASGSGRLAELRFGVLPQVLPVLVANALYFFESNTRQATVLGVVGAGGIGLALADRMRVNDWDQVSFIVIMILITVAIIDWGSKAIRQRLTGRQTAH